MPGLRSSAPSTGLTVGLHSNVVGATADLLVECDEAQDVRRDKWSKDFYPVGASTNVTTSLWGTAWTSDMLLAQMIQYLRRFQARDGRRGPACMAYVAGEVQASVSC